MSGLLCRSISCLFGNIVLMLRCRFIKVDEIVLFASFFFYLRFNCFSFTSMVIAEKFVFEAFISEWLGQFLILRLRYLHHNWQALPCIWCGRSCTNLRIPFSLLTAHIVPQVKEVVPGSPLGNYSPNWKRIAAGVQWTLWDSICLAISPVFRHNTGIQHYGRHLVSLVVQTFAVGLGCVKPRERLGSRGIIWPGIVATPIVIIASISRNCLIVGMIEFTAIVAGTLVVLWEVRLGVWVCVFEVVSQVIIVVEEVGEAKVAIISLRFLPSVLMMHLVVKATIFAMAWDGSWGRTECAYLGVVIVLLLVSFELLEVR